MLTHLATLLRGQIQEASEAEIDRNAIVLLRQQIRDGAAATLAARRAVAVAIAQNGQEIEHHRNIVGRIAALEERTIAALDLGKTALAREGAEAIARLEVERDASGRSQESFQGEIERLKQIVLSAEARLRELRRGERMAAATERTQRLRQAPNGSGLPVLGEAEATLARLQGRQREIEATALAIEQIDTPDDPQAVIGRLAQAGCGPSLTPTAEDVLGRLRLRLAPPA